MASVSSRTSQIVVGIVASAIKIVATTAILAIRKRRSRRRRSPFEDDDSIKSLVATDEEHEDQRTRSRTVLVRSRSPSTPRRSFTSESTRTDGESSPPVARQDVLVQSVPFTPSETRTMLFPKNTSSTSSTQLTKAIDLSFTSCEDESYPVVISNLKDMTHQQKSTTSSGASLVPGSPEFVEFHLPKLNADYYAGGTFDPSMDDPTLLRNILRPWQCEFLESCGIATAQQFIKAKKRRNLAKAMKKWREHNNLQYVKKKCRKVALHIWAQTCKAVIESVKKQQVEGKTHLEKPQTLLTMSVSNTSRSTAATLSSETAVVTGILARQSFGSRSSPVAVKVFPCHKSITVPQSIEPRNIDNGMEIEEEWA